jgi:type IV secretory pathway TrbD component
MALHLPRTSYPQCNTSSLSLCLVLHFSHSCFLAHSALYPSHLTPLLVHSHSCTPRYQVGAERVLVLKGGEVASMVRICVCYVATFLVCVFVCVCVCVFVCLHPADPTYTNTRVRERVVSTCVGG